MSDLKPTEKMEKVFVHPECPFSENTFNLLTEFYENPSSDFYMAHKRDFLKDVENPLKYISTQVEELLPDFIKKYINTKSERLGNMFFEAKGVKSIPYSVSLGCRDINYIGNSNLNLILNNEELIFGFQGKLNDIDSIINRYIDSHNNSGVMDCLRLYHLTNQYQCYLTNQIIRLNCRVSEEHLLQIKPQNFSDIFNLIFSLLVTEPPKFKKYKITNLLVYKSLKREEVLEYSTRQLIYRITQTFKKVFPLFFLCSNQEDKDAPLPIVQYFSIYEKEFNRGYDIKEISETTGFQTSELNRWIRTINRKQQAIIQGPPGTGKTFLAQKLAQHLIGGGDGFSDTIQFHPAYTYEDFIQGIRPQSQDGQLTYPIVPGRFLEFCEKAEVCEDTCVLIIDEINRANLSQVFGELMYLLDDRQDTKRFITLASGQKFRIPTNVRIIGTMNTADRSIALVDQALRRRFAFVPLYPNYELLQNYHNREETGFAVDKLINLLKNVNLAINNKHYELGISFFLTKTLAEDMQDIWQMEIEPYLEEYFFDSLEKMDEFLWENIKTKLGY